MKSVPRVLHVGNVANAAAELRDALGSLGLAECLVVETHNNRLQFAEDARFTWDWLSSAYRRLERSASLVLLLKGLVSEADIVHVHHAGRIPLAVQRWARAKGKRVVRHFRGEELRSGGAGGEVGTADFVFVSTPDLLQHVPADYPKERVAWMPNPYRFPDVCPPQPPAGSIRIVHSYLPGATYAAVYGTEIVRKAVASLKSAGHDIELDEVAGVPHGEALSRYRQAHIAVDKLLIGWHGMFSVECAALGRPPLAGIAPDLAHLRPPVIPVTEDTLMQTLESLSQSEVERERIARALFERGKSLHGADAVARRVAAVYQSLLA